MIDNDVIHKIYLTYIQGVSGFYGQTAGLYSICGNKKKVYKVW